MTPFQLKRGQWYDAETGVKYVGGKFISSMAGYPEYSVTVANQRNAYTRFVIPVRCEGDEGFDGWADTTTGSLYVDNKVTGSCQCLSGPLTMLGKPHKTGRVVPGLDKRKREGQERSAAGEFGDEA